MQIAIHMVIKLSRGWETQLVHLVIAFYDNGNPRRWRNWSQDPHVQMERNHMGGSPIPLRSSPGQQSTTTLEQQTWYQIILLSTSTSTTPSNIDKVLQSLTVSQSSTFKTCEII